MNVFIPCLLLSILTACSQPGKDSGNWQAQVDSLQRKLDNSYKPGLGEFMSGIQVHHAKLWFAGQAQNWQLADFEVAELKESLALIKKYCAERPETNSIGMIDPAMVSIANAIQKKDAIQFKDS